LTRISEITGLMAKIIRDLAGLHIVTGQSFKIIVPLLFGNKIIYSKSIYIQLFDTIHFILEAELKGLIEPPARLSRKLL
jgi:hypothetical protein